MGRGAMGDVYSDLFGGEDLTADFGMGDLGLTGSLYQDLFAQDPIQGLPKAPFQFAVEDPAQDPFQFPFQFPSEQPNESGYGAQYAPVDMPENLLQEIDELNPANDKGGTEPGNTLVGDIRQIGSDLADMLGLPGGGEPSKGVSNKAIWEAMATNLWNLGSDAVDEWGGFDFTESMKEQSQVGFADLLGQAKTETPSTEPTVETPSAESPISLEDIWTVGNISSMASDQGESNQRGELGDQTPNFFDLETNPVPLPFEMSNDLRGAEDFNDIGQPTADRMDESKLGSTLQEQSPEPSIGELAAFMDTVPDGAYQAWDDLRQKDEGGMSHSPTEEPGANGQIGNMTDLDKGSPAARNVETENTVGVDLNSKDIATGKILEAVGLDVLPEIPSLLEIAAKVIAAL